jgi:hypothetical protein
VSRYARCDYCGCLFPIQEATIYWAHVETLDDGRELCTTGIYCSEPCGEWAVSRTGA